MAKSENSVTTFVWSGLDASGQRVKKRKVEAANVGAAVAQLRREGSLPVEVKDAPVLSLDLNIGPSGVKWKYAKKAEFARRLHQMQRAGISLPKALSTMAVSATPAEAKIFHEMAAKVQAGQTFSAALAEHPRTFDDVFVSYVRAGEESGETQAALGQLATLLAKRAAMQSKIKGVMAYPKMVGGTILVLVFAIITFLVPTYAKIYASFNAKLPAPTLALVWASHHMLPVGLYKIQHPFIFAFPIPKPFNLISLILYVVIAWRIFKKRTAGDLEVGRKLDMIKFRFPVMGQLWHKASLFQWSSTLAGALAAGVPMYRALDLAAAASGSRWQQLASVKFADAVRTGRPMNLSMHEEGRLYPPEVIAMVSTGEETGETDTMIASAAGALDEDVESLVAGLSAKIEVALLLVLGIVVGALLMVLYMPILQLATTASKGMGGPGSGG